MLEADDNTEKKMTYNYRITNKIIFFFLYLEINKFIKHRYLVVKQIGWRKLFGTMIYIGSKIFDKILHLYLCASVSGVDFECFSSNNYASYYHICLYVVEFQEYRSDFEELYD